METNNENKQGEVETLNTFRLDSLQDLFLNELKDAYAGEISVIEEFPKLKELISSSELKEAFEDYLKISRGHVKMIEKIYSSLRVPNLVGECQGVEGIFEQNRKFVNVSDPYVRDAAFITTVQKIAHVRISAWGTLKAFAKELNYTDAVDGFQDAMDEEIEIDDVLSDIAEDYINQNAI